LAVVSVQVTSSRLAIGHPEISQVRDEEKVLVNQLSDLGHFLRALRIQMRFGELSRASLQLLRFEVRGEAAECEWMARPADEWDKDLTRQVVDKNVSIQALQDAIAVRELIFSAIPGIDAALLRAYRQPAGSGRENERELIITGTVTRADQVLRNSSSLAMQAKLLGLQFWLEDGVLEALQSDEYAMSF
jgi:hypothetical protein